MERSFWREIIDNRYRIPEGHELGDLTVELIEYLPSPDSELRDTFAYNILARWIIVYGYYSPDELRKMIEWLTPGLNKGLGEQDTDTVFLRSYSALVLSILVYRDTQIHFLDEAEVRALLDRARQYFIAEQDLRAYVPEKGWANAWGNTADLLKFLARNVSLDTADLLRILDVIADKLTAQTLSVHMHDEDDRLAQVVMAVLRRDALTFYELSGWVNRFQDWKTALGEGADYDPVYQTTYHNIKGFLRSLYCYIELAPQIPIEVQDFLPDLLAVLQAFSL